MKTSFVSLWNFENVPHTNKYIARLKVYVCTSHFWAELCMLENKLGQNNYFFLSWHFFNSIFLHNNPNVLMQR
jgi:hypothetical protein